MGREAGREGGREGKRAGNGVREGGGKGGEEGMGLGREGGREGVGFALPTTLNCSPAPRPQPHSARWRPGWRAQPGG